jgi:hypothetical protein
LKDKRHLPKKIKNNKTCVIAITSPSQLANEKKLKNTSTTINEAYSTVTENHHDGTTCKAAPEKRKKKNSYSRIRKPDNNVNK